MLLTALLSQGLTEGKVKAWWCRLCIALIAIDPPARDGREGNLEGQTGSFSASVASWQKAKDRAWAYVLWRGRRLNDQSSVDTLLFTWFLKVAIAAGFPHPWGSICFGLFSMRITCLNTSAEEYSSNSAAEARRGCSPYMSLVCLFFLCVCVQVLPDGVWFKPALGKSISLGSSHTARSETAHHWDVQQSGEWGKVMPEQPLAEVPASLLLQGCARCQ